jgi:hypothetical protein
VETALVGTTPTFNLGTTAAGVDIAAGIALTAGTVTTPPIAALVHRWRPKLRCGQHHRHAHRW